MQAEPYNVVTFVLTTLKFRRRLSFLFIVNIDLYLNLTNLGVQLKRYNKKHLQVTKFHSGLTDTDILELLRP